MEIFLLYNNFYKLLSIKFLIKKKILKKLS